MGPILLATDGSEYARDAAGRAVDLAAELDAPLHVISVVDRRKFDGPALGSAELATIYAEERASLSVAEVSEMAAARDVPVEVATMHGVPEETILAYADEVGATTIVLGEHGDHAVHFCGVGRRVAGGADCEVLVGGE